MSNNKDLSSVEEIRRDEEMPETLENENDAEAKDQTGIGENSETAAVVGFQKHNLPEDPFENQELFFLAYPKVSYQIFLCRECRNRQLSCINENVKKEESRYQSINISLCPYCIHANLRIYHAYRSL